MNHRPQTQRPRAAVMVMLILVSLVMLTTSILSAQTPTPTGTPIEISGVVSQINARTIVVAGLTVDVGAIALDTNVTVGTTVTVTGHLTASNVIVAQVIVIVNPRATNTPAPVQTMTATPEMTPTATATPNPNLIVVIEGPVVNIVTNIITIYDFDIEVEPANPILDLIEIGQIIHVEGVFNNAGVIVASVVSNLSSVTTVTTGATVSMDGPIEAINGNIVIVNGIPVQFEPNDPRLSALQIGNFLNVQGNFQNNGTTIVLVVVNVVVVNNVIVNGNPFCWYHEKGMGMGMGHWHCDGMGMGMGMGMGR